MARVPKKEPNLKRAKEGPWNGETFNTADSIDGVPRKGWCLVNGMNSVLSTLYYNGMPIERVAAVSFDNTAGEVPRMHITLVMPELKVITRGPL